MANELPRYLRCSSCRMILDTVTGAQVIGAISATSQSSGDAEKRLAHAMANAEPFVCEGCAFVARHQPRTTPPDPSTYEKLAR